MIKALICDDELATRTIISYFLEKEKMPIELVGYAKNGEEAIRLIEEFQPQLIFLDLQMPKLTGFQVIEQMVHEKRAKVIIVTAFASFQNARQALQFGVCDILPKPIELEQLRKAITRAVGWNFTTNETMNQMLEYIHTHYKENFELETLTKLTYCTENHLSRLFKKHMGLSIKAYAHQLRIQEACRLFDSQRCDIRETAFQIGYSSMNNFYKYFKRYTGKTPAQYLKAGKKM